tara:strand:- start:2393 stop:5206 length:2814 start_codon:yes stop_codon:yes gene_type:complete
MINNNDIYDFDINELKENDISDILENEELWTNDNNESLKMLKKENNIFPTLNNKMPNENTILNFDSNKKYDYIESKKNELYSYLQEDVKTIITYKRNEKLEKLGKEYEYPIKMLYPKIIIIILGKKTFKKRIILETLLLKKNENNMMPILNYKLNYIQKEASIYELNETHNRKSNSERYGRLSIYNIIKDKTKELKIKISDNNTDNIFNNADSMPESESCNILKINKNDFIKPTIIITSIEKIYYWEMELININKTLVVEENNNIFNYIIINRKNKIYEYNQNNNYDIILIRNDLFPTFCEIKITNNILHYNSHIYNRLIIDDIYQNITNKTFYFNHFHYHNCLEIIIINRQYINNGINNIIPKEKKVGKNKITPLHNYKDNIIYLEYINRMFNNFTKSAIKIINDVVKEISVSPRGGILPKSIAPYVPCAPTPVSPRGVAPYVSQSPKNHIDKNNKKMGKSNNTQPNIYNLKEEINKNEKKINIYIYKNNINKNFINSIIKILNYYIGNNHNLVFILDLLQDIDLNKINTNIILSLFYEFNYILDNNNELLKTLINNKNELYNELYTLIQIINNKKQNSKMDESNNTPPHKLILTKENSINQLKKIYLINKTYISKNDNNIISYLQNLIKYEYNIILEETNGEKIILKNILLEYNNIILKLNRYIINIKINIIKIQNIVNNYKLKISENLYKNKCSYCEKNIKTYYIYECCYNICCDICDELNFKDSLDIECKNCKEKINTNMISNLNLINSDEIKIYNYNLNEILKNKIEFKYNNILTNKILIKNNEINTTVMDINNIVYNIIKNIIIKKNSYKIIIYTHIIEDILSILLKYNLRGEVFDGTYDHKKNILKILDNKTNENLILILNTYDIKLSINTDNITDIIYNNKYYYNMKINSDLNLVFEQNDKKNIYIKTNIITQFLKIYKPKTIDFYILT